MKKHLPLAIRIIISFLFILSAVAKMYPSPYFAISTFEVKQLYPMGFSEGTAALFSRTLIGIELALGVLLLQRHYLKKFVVPATILMLVVFIIHLTIDTISNGNAGSCGCFGELLPMTPVEAIIKNIVSVVVLAILYKMLPADNRRNFCVLTTVGLAGILLIFMLAPIRPTSAAPETPAYDLTEGGVTTPAGTTANDSITTVMPSAEAPVEAKPTTAATPAQLADNAPAQKKTAYSQYLPNADKGKKIIGLFAPGCEHCRETVKQLTEMKAKNKNFPELQIIFMDEEADLIPDFFKFAGAEYPYKVVDIIAFWKVLGNGKDTPGVVYLWNGNVVKEWDGINEKAFSAKELATALNKK